MYVSNNEIRYENIINIILYNFACPRNYMPQRYSTTTDISHCEALNCDPEIRFLSPEGHRLPWCRCYLPWQQTPLTLPIICQQLFNIIKFLSIARSVQQLNVQLFLGFNVWTEQRRKGSGIA